MQKCFLFNLLISISGIILLNGLLCQFLMLIVPKRWIFTKVGFMVWKRWMGGLGDKDMYNKFGKILYGAVAFGMVAGLGPMSVLIALQKMGIFGLGCMK